MKYFTLGIIFIVLGLLISSFKDAEMKSFDRVEIQDDKLHAITDPMTGLKEEQERQAPVCGNVKTHKTFGECYQENCQFDWMHICDCNDCTYKCGGCKVNCKARPGTFLSHISDEWCQENCKIENYLCPACKDLSDSTTAICEHKCACDVNGFEEFTVDVKETCATKFQIGENRFNEGEDTCRERCRSDPDCNYYFYTSKETCNDFFESYMALNCDLYKDCSKRRTPGCNGRTFRKTDGWYAVGG